MLACSPSPDLSVCSEDLAAILDAAGPISHFPTPPSKQDKWIAPTQGTATEAHGIYDHNRAANLLVEEGAIEVVANPDDVWHVHNMLLRAQLPFGLVAFAFNILRSLNNTSFPIGSFCSSPSDLMVVSALSLAMSYTYDHPLTYQAWSRDVCLNAWTAHQIDKTALDILLALDFRLLSCASKSNLESAATLLCPDPGILEKSDREMPLLDTSESAKAKSGLWSDHGVAQWINGQVTPETSPTGITPNLESCQFLPLL